MRSVAIFAALALLGLPAAGTAADRDPDGRGPMRDMPNWVRPPPAPGHSYPECVCINRGDRFPLGATSCLRVDGQEFTAQCRESVNVSIWRKVQDGCDPQPAS